MYVHTFVALGGGMKEYTRFNNLLEIKHQKSLCMKENRNQNVERI